MIVVLFKAGGSGPGAWKISNCILRRCPAEGRLPGCWPDRRADNEMLTQIVGLANCVASWLILLFDRIHFPVIAGSSWAEAFGEKALAP